jgi:hypothetical protein
MRPKILLALLAGLFLLGGAVPTQAQFNFTVTTPFAFQVQGKQFPAGKYVFKQLEANRPFTITSPKGDITGSFEANFNKSEHPMEKAHTELLFHRFGDKYFLAGLFAHHMQFAVGSSPAEKEFEQSGVAMTEVKLSIKM